MPTAKPLIFWIVLALVAAYFILAATLKFA